MPLNQKSGSWCANCGHGMGHGATRCDYDFGLVPGASTRRQCDCTSYVDADLMEQQRQRDHEIHLKRLEIELERAKAGLK